MKVFGLAGKRRLNKRLAAMPAMTCSMSSRRPTPFVPHSSQFAARDVIRPADLWIVPDQTHALLGLGN